MTRIVLAGAGFTALEAAPLLKEALPDAKITLISKHKTRQLQFPAELLNGHIDHYDIEAHCAKTNVECIIGEITSINRKEKYVHVGESLVHYDYLLLDVGSQPSRTTQGLEHSFPSHNAKHIHAIRHHIISQLIHAKVDYEPVHRTFVIAGGTVQAIETAAEVKNLIDHLCERHLFFPDEMDVVLVTHGQHIPREIKDSFEKRDIEIYEKTVRKYTGAGVHLSDRIIETHTLIWTATQPNHLLSTLSLQLDVQGAAVVNEYLQTSDANVFAAGGCADRTRNIPMTALHRDDAQVVSHNIAASIKHGLLKPFQEKHKPYTISTGNGKALLISKYFNLYGGLPNTIRQWCLAMHRVRIQKA